MSALPMLIITAVRRAMPSMMRGRTMLFAVSIIDALMSRHYTGRSGFSIEDLLQLASVQPNSMATAACIDLDSLSMNVLHIRMATRACHGLLYR